MIPLAIGRNELLALQALSELAFHHPVDMPALLERLKTPEGKAAHMAQMGRQSVPLPFGWLVTFSIEEGHPCGTCRHMSMSCDNPDRLPSPEAVWMVALDLGFVGGLWACSIWKEELTQGLAINVVQPLQPAEVGHG